MRYYSVERLVRKKGLSLSLLPHWRKPEWWCFNCKYWSTRKTCPSCKGTSEDVAIWFEVFANKILEQGIV
jgi:hypothetical protein